MALATCAGCWSGQTEHKRETCSRNQTYYRRAWSWKRGQSSRRKVNDTWAKTGFTFALESQSFWQLGFLAHHMHNFLCMQWDWILSWINWSFKILTHSNSGWKQHFSSMLWHGKQSYDTPEPVRINLYRTQARFNCDLKTGKSMPSPSQAMPGMHEHIQICIIWEWRVTYFPKLTYYSEVGES